MPGVHLLQDKAEKDQRVAELEGRAHDVQMLKFGQVRSLRIARHYIKAVCM